ncbi:hypothetical protein LCGC14_0579130 [marine sediment metagenome]|uniref:Uncharacterized protein n=1 Tax=marine sediment metagenome TaxID=412755 RepID=A0A0F9RM20_9ZZZZ
MSKSKKKKTNPIENAIGDRTQTPEKLSPSKMSEQSKQELRDLSIPQDLEALNQQTEERLLDSEPMEPTIIGNTIVPQTQQVKTPVSKPDLPPATETSSQESPPQKVNYRCSQCEINFRYKTELIGHICPTPEDKVEIDNLIKEAESPPQEKDNPPKSDYTCISCGTFYGNKDALDDNKRCAMCISVAARSVNHIERYNETADKLGIPKIETPQKKVDMIALAKHIKDHSIDCPDCGICTSKPAEDKDLVALKEYVLSNGFVPSAVAMHIVMLCSQPLVTPSTTTWDFKDRANVPDMVFAILKTLGYLEGIWPSLKIIMGTNVGNPAWCASIATTIAFFDCIRTLPTLKELKNEDTKTL